MQRTNERRWLPARARFALRRPAWRRLPDVLPRLALVAADRRWRWREARFFGTFSAWIGFLTAHPYRAFPGAASGANEGSGSVAIGALAAIVRANLTEPA